MTGPRIVPLTGIKSLTPNELKVLKLVVEDYDNEEIAEQLSVKAVSIKTYLTVIYDKLGFFGHRNRRGKRSMLVAYAKKELGV